MIEAPDEPRRDEADRYAVYAVHPGTRARRRVCETSSEHVMAAVEFYEDEGEIPRGWRVGVFDRAARTWPINPFA